MHLYCPNIDLRVCHVNSVLQKLHMDNNLTIPNYNNTVITTSVNGRWRIMYNNYKIDDSQRSPLINPSFVFI